MTARAFLINGTRVGAEFGNMALTSIDVESSKNGLIYHYNNGTSSSCYHISNTGVISPLLYIDAMAFL